MFKLFAFILLFLGSSAIAEDDPTQCQFEGSWGDIEGRSSTIMIVRQNHGHFDDEDSLMVAFFNDDWSIEPDENIGVIKVENEDGGWFSNTAIAMEHGFLIWSEFKHIENVFDGMPAGMFITRNGKTVDKLKLSSLFSEWIDFKSCRNKKVVAKAEQKRKQKLKLEIPQDPFSK